MRVHGLQHAVGIGKVGLAKDDLAVDAIDPGFHIAEVGVDDFGLVEPTAEDEVMRGVWKRCHGGPMREDDFAALLTELSGRSFERELADWVVRPRLLTIPGVSQVIPIGGEVKQYRVTPDVARMHALDITHEQIVTALRQFGANSGGGYVDQAGRGVFACAAQQQVVGLVSAQHVVDQVR